MTVKHYPPLTPVTSPWMHTISKASPVLDQLFDRYGSPLNIHSTTPFAENYAQYKAVFDEFDLNHLVLFARKANKTRGFITASKKLGIGVDTASYQELKQCIEAGIEVGKLVVTAAIKDVRLMQLAIKYGVLVILDNRDECNLAQSVAKELNTTANVGIRVSGFRFDGEKLYSRFGFDIDEVGSLIKNNFGNERAFNRLVYKGLHFHLNGYSIEQRGAALHQCIEISDALTSYRLTTEFIDIGGGLLMNYLEKKDEWEHFKAQLQRAVKGEIAPITFQNNGLGYELVNGKLQGALSTYPYYNETPRAIFLRQILSDHNNAGKTAAYLLKSKNIQLRMEPGRSLLDQTGVTVAKVAFRKRDAQDNWLVGIEMNMTQMFSSSSDFLLDPLMIYKHKADDEPVAVNFTGAYCLERDILLKRKIALKRLPEIGDMVMFYNTAGYMMHFFESEAHLFELATNLFYQPQGQCLSTADFINEHP